MKLWAVYRYGKQVSKAYPLREQALIDAVERKLVWNASADFIGDKDATIWLDGAEIKEFTQEEEVSHG